MASGDGMAQGNETSATTCWLGTSTNVVTVVWSGPPSAFAVSRSLDWLRWRLCI